MTDEQIKLAEDLLDCMLKEEDARFIQNILTEDRELNDDEELKLIMLYDEEFGYYEGSL